MTSRSLQLEIKEEENGCEYHHRDYRGNETDTKIIRVSYEDLYLIGNPFLPITTKEINPEVAKLQSIKEIGKNVLRYVELNCKGWVYGGHTPTDKYVEIYLEKEDEPETTKSKKQNPLEGLIDII